MITNIKVYQSCEIAKINAAKMSRGYSTSYKPSYYQGGRYNGNRDSYLSSIQEGRASSSGGGHSSRGTTPIERSGVEAPAVGLSMLAAAINGSNNRKAVRESKNYGITSTYTPAAYKYFSRSDNFYNPTILFNRSMATDNASALTKRECKFQICNSNDHIKL